jgi:hypothetical protein
MVEHCALLRYAQMRPLLGIIGKRRPIYADCIGTVKGISVTTTGPFRLSRCFFPNARVLVINSPTSFNKVEIWRLKTQNLIFYKYWLAPYERNILSCFSFYLYVQPFYTSVIVCTKVLCLSICFFLGDD